MKTLDNIHADRFYTDLALNGHLIEETVEGQNEDGEWSTFYGFDDAIDEAPYENVTLNDHGIAYYAHEGKVYQVTVFIENSEGTGVNELEADEIKELAERLLEESNDLGYSEAEFYEKEPWAMGLL
ncbi:MAG: hypothetical protein ACO3MV_02050 [Flavobacteriales bacterium]